MWRLIPLLFVCACAGFPIEIPVDFSVKGMKEKYRLQCWDRVIEPGIKCKFYSNWKLEKCRPKFPLACKQPPNPEEERGRQDETKTVSVLGGSVLA